MSMYSKLIEDKKKWKEIVESNFLTEKITFLQSFEWLELQKQSGNSVFPLVFYKNDGTIFGAAACVVIRAKRGKYLYIRNGPLITDWTDTERIKEVFEMLKKIAQEEKLWFIRISPLLSIENSESEFIKNQNYPISPMYDVDAVDTYVWDIQNSSSKDLKNQIKKKTNYEIRKASKLSPEIEISTNPADIDYFYNILEETIKRQDWVSQSKEYIRNEFREFVHSNLGYLVLIKMDGVYVSAGVFIEYAGSVFYHYGATKSDYLKKGAAYLMIWEAVEEAKRRNSQFFNFFGIAPENKPNHPWNGLTTFKMKFPGEVRRWLPTRDIPISPLYWLTNVYDKIDKIKKGY